MRIVIPDDYQDAVERLACFSLLDGHEVTRYREPAASFEALVERLKPADAIVAIRERVEFNRALIERLPNLKLIALVGRNATTIDYAACTEHGIQVSRGESNSPAAPAELTVALILASAANGHIPCPIACAVPPSAFSVSATSAPSSPPPVPGWG